MSSRSSAVDRLAELEEVRFGSALLRLLSLGGWQIDVRDGRVRAVKNGVGEVARAGTMADVAPDVFVAAVQLQRRSRTNAADA